MIEILTKEGISLDLKSDLDIEFTIEQALLDSDNMPVGISTTIAFPLSTKNRIVFGIGMVLLLVQRIVLSRRKC